MANSGDVGSTYLNEFRAAKLDIQNLFTEISKVSGEISDYLTETLHNDKFKALLTCQIEDILKIKIKTTKINEIIERNQMKCAFFGRTSNGKSTTINAMLGAKILPSGIGHTTSCFVLIQGIDSDTGYVLQDGVQTPLSILGNKASALSSSKLSSDSLMTVFVPKKDCNLLKEEVQLLDSPGINVNPDLDEWIDSHCLDADVFILVANSESTLMQTEKDFFHKVSSKISKPNVFVLNNRWDASANEEEFVEEVKSQHLERCISFLADELKICTKEQAEERVFFVSAREVLTQRMKKDINNSGSGLNSPGGLPMFPNWQERLFEFERFEKQFERTLSISATKTKFNSHVEEGFTLVDNIESYMKSLNENAEKENKAAQVYASHIHGEYKKLFESQSGQNQDKITAGITKLGALTESIVNKSLDSELVLIRRSVDSYEDKNFSTDPTVLEVYKKQLSEHLERQLRKKLGSDCSQEISKKIYQAKEQLFEFYKQFVTDEEIREKLKNHANLEDPFEAKFHIDCRNLTSDFTEDLEFHFSLNPSQFMSILKSPAAVNGLNQISKFFPSVMGSNTFAGAIILGLLMKVSGWRLISFCSACYGTIYFYERLSWNNSAKKSAFKRQFTDHICRKVKLIANITSSHVRHQVEEEFDKSWKGIRREIENQIVEYEKKCTELENDIEKLHNIAMKSMLYMTTAQKIRGTLDRFTNTYIRT